MEKEVCRERYPFNRMVQKTLVREQLHGAARVLHTRIQFVQGAPRRTRTEVVVREMRDTRDGEPRPGRGQREEPATRNPIPAARRGQSDQ